MKLSSVNSALGLVVCFILALSDAASSSRASTTTTSTATKKVDHDTSESTLITMRSAPANDASKTKGSVPQQRSAAAAAASPSGASASSSGGGGGTASASAGVADKSESRQAYRPNYAQRPYQDLHNVPYGIPGSYGMPGYGVPNGYGFPGGYEVPPGFGYGINPTGYPYGYGGNVAYRSFRDYNDDYGEISARALSSKRPIKGSKPGKKPNNMDSDSSEDVDSNGQGSNSSDSSDYSHKIYRSGMLEQPFALTGHHFGGVPTPCPHYEPPFLSEYGVSPHGIPNFPVQGMAFPVQEANNLPALAMQRMMLQQMNMPGTGLSRVPPFFGVPPGGSPFLQGQGFLPEVSFNGYMGQEYNPMQYQGFPNIGYDLPQNNYYW
ncbi:uncharacterized protein [Periplaneta americana]|uniref:uncharacterized protein n=1 Tax=Periplaneta americana TaxID=6978 RepID=UPI0037E99365